MKLWMKKVFPNKEGIQQEVELEPERERENIRAIINHFGKDVLMATLLVEEGLPSYGISEVVDLYDENREMERALEETERRFKELEERYASIFGDYWLY